MKNILLNPQKPDYSDLTIEDKELLEATIDFFENRGKIKLKDNCFVEQKIDVDSNDNEYLFDKLAAKAYMNKTYLTAWIDTSKH